MFVFNGKEYHNEFYGMGINSCFKIEIDTSLSILDYIEKVKKEEEIDARDMDGVINAQSDYGLTFHTFVTKEDLLMVLYANAGICPLFAKMEEYKNTPLTELQILSNQLLWNTNIMFNANDQMKIEDIRTFFHMSKYSQRILKESNLNGSDQISILKALTKLYEEKKMLPEYSKNLNTYLHTLFGRTSNVNEKILTSLIDFYYHAPYLAYHFVGSPRYSSMEKVIDYLSEHELIRDELNTWVMEKVDSDKIEEILHLIEDITGENRYDYDNYHDSILYTVPEKLDSVENMFAAPKLQNMLKNITPTTYSYWCCPELKIEGTLDESNVAKLEKFVKAINDKINKLSLHTIGYKKASLDMIDSEILERLKNQIGPIYEVNSDFRKALAQLLFKSKLFEIGNSEYNTRCSIIEKSGEKYNTPYGKIYKCENAIEHNITKTYFSMANSLPYIENSHPTLRHAVFYRTTPEVVKNMELTPLKETKDQSLDDEILKLMKNLSIIKSTMRQEIKHIKEVFAKKTVQCIPIIEPKSPYAKLQEAFETKFGRAPRIMPQITMTLFEYFKGHEQEFIDNFNYKNIAKIIGEKTPTMLRLSMSFNWSETPKELQELLKCYATLDNVETIANNKNLIIEAYKVLREKELFTLIGFIDRVPQEKLDNINEKIQRMYDTKNYEIKNALKAEIENDINNLIYEAKQEMGRLDAIKAEKEFEYSVINNSSELLGDNVCVMTGPYRAYFLNSMDYEHFSVGYDTYCCQHIGGAGEECVIAATSSSHCGTLVIKSHDGETKAQAFVWEALDKNGDRVLVLDNIEFANDREVKDYLEILYAFCKESPYQTIHLGLGFNEEMSNVGTPISKDELVCRPIIPFMEQNTFDYSDYNHAVCLKQNGEMTFNVETTYYTQKFDTPSIIETKTHGVNLDGDTLVAQHYNVYHDNCSKTTIVINKDGQLLEPTQYPTYPFESTYVNPNNHMMKWENLEATSIAITISQERNGLIMIKPIAIDGNEIKKLNVEQSQTLMEKINEIQETHPHATIALATASPYYLREIQSIKELRWIKQEEYIYCGPNEHTIYGDEISNLPKFDDIKARLYEGDMSNIYEWEGDMFDDDEWDNNGGEDIDDNEYEELI